MASKSDRSVTESIRDDFLTCHICYEVFTDPRILPCLHTYCFQCICTHVDTVQKNGRHVVCPECREPFSHVVSSLKPNFFINGLSEVVKEKSAEHHPCTTCHLMRKDSIASVKCLDCGDYLCSTCSDGHNSSSITWKHEKIPLNDIKQGIYDEKLRNMQKIKCPKHEDKDVEFYCKTCSKSVCLTCVLLDHRDHKCKTIREAVCDKKTSIGGLTEKLREKISLFIAAESKMTSKIEILMRRDTKERLEIENQAKMEIAKINAKKKDSLDKIAKKTKVAQKENEGHLETLRLKKSLVSSCVNFSDNILKNGKDEEILLLEDLVTDRLKQLQMNKEGNLEDTELKSFDIGSDLDQQDKQRTNEGRPPEITAAIQNTSDQLYETTHYQSHETASGKDNQRKTKTDASAHSEMGYDTEIKFRMRNIFSAKSSTDLSKPGVKGMVYSSKLGLILSDAHNGKIKIMSTVGGLQQEITTTEFKPFAVAVAGDTIGAVSENYLLLFTSQGSLKKRVKVSEQKPNEGYLFTYSLAASETVGFVVGNIHGGNRLVFYNLDGKFVRFLYCSVQFPLAALSITPAEDIVLSEWGCGRIRVISPEGTLKFKTKTCRWRPNGTCTSKKGYTFVADYEQGTISVYSSTGDFLLEHSTRSGGIGNPKYVTTDENGLLYVVDYAGKICVYKVHS